MKKLLRIIALVVAAPALLISGLAQAQTSNGTLMKNVPVNPSATPADSDLMIDETGTNTFLQSYLNVTKYMLGKVTADCTINTATFQIQCLSTGGVPFGTFATQDYASPPVIGGIAPNSATFTALRVTGLAGVVGCVQTDINGNLTNTSVGCGTGSGGVNSVSVNTANGLGGTSSGGSTPALTLFPTFTGVGFSDGTQFRAAIPADFPTLNQDTTGNAATATAFAATPSQCAAGQSSTGIQAGGNANCSVISAFQVDATPLTNPSTINYEDSALTGGLTLTFSNPSLGNVQLGLSGWPSLINGDCLTNNGTILQWGSCSGSGASITGSPASGNLTKFSGASSITNGDLSGDVTTSGTLATTVVKIGGVAVGTFATQNYATPPVIGGTTPAAGNFTTVNGNTLTTGTYTLTGSSGKTLTFNNSLTLAGTDATTMTFPATSGTVDVLNNAQTFTAAKTFTNSDLLLLGSSTGFTTFTSANAGASNFTLTFPGITDTVATLTATQTLTNKSIAASEINSGQLAIANGGTNAATAAAALTNLLPSQGGNSGDFLTTDGTSASWASVAGSGTVNSGTAGNMTYYATTTTAVSQTPGVTFAAAGGDASGALVTISDTLRLNSPTVPANNPAVAVSSKNGIRYTGDSGTTLAVDQSGNGAFAMTNVSGFSAALTGGYSFNATSNVEQFTGPNGGAGTFKTVKNTSAASNSFGALQTQDTSALGLSLISQYPTGVTTIPSGFTCASCPLGANYLFSTGAKPLSIAIGATAGTLAESMRIYQADGGITVGAATGGDKGAGTLNAVNLYVNGVAVGSGGGGTPANPTGTVGLAAVNGVLTTYMRSDAAPPLSQSIAPTWTGNHTFTPAAGVGLTVNGLANSNTSKEVGSGTSGQSLGPLIQAGTNASDYTFLAQNFGGSVNNLKIFGDGGITTGAAADEGAGTVNVTGTGYYVNGTLVSQQLPVSAPLVATNGSRVASPVTLGTGLAINTGVLVNQACLNPQVGTSYLILTSDAACLVTLSNASPVAVTLSTPSGGFGAGFSVDLQNKGAGLVTVTPPGGVLINGASSLTMAQNLGCTVTSDGTNYQISACTAIVPTVSVPKFTYGAISTTSGGCALQAAVGGHNFGSANIASCARNSIGNYTLTLTSAYTNYPACTASVDTNSVINAVAYNAASGSALGSITFTTYTSGAAADTVGFTLNCMGT